MLIENIDDFKEWLAKTLLPICDADPTTLSRYVLALVKKDKPEKELRDICMDQLDVFLQTKTKNFVELLFETLITKSYVKVTSSDIKAADQAKAVPVQPTTKQIEPEKKKEENKTSDDKPVNNRDNQEGRDRKRRSSSPRSRNRDVDDRRRHHGDRSRHSPDRRYGRRRSDRSSSPRSRSRKSPDRSRRRDRSRSPRSRSKSWGKHKSRSRSNSAGRKTDSRGSTPTQDNGLYTGAIPVSGGLPNVQSAASLSSLTNENNKRNDAIPKNVVPGPPGTRPRCQDYEEKGFCVLGDMCPFDHGADPVVVEDVALPSVIPFPPPGPPQPPIPLGPPPSGPPPRGHHPRGMPPHIGPPHVPPPGFPPHPDIMLQRPAHIRPVDPQQPFPRPDPYQPEGYNPEAPELTESSEYWDVPRGSRGQSTYHNHPRHKDLIQVQTVEDIPPEKEVSEPKKTMEVPKTESSQPKLQSRVVVASKRPFSAIDNNSGSNQRQIMDNSVGRGAGRGTRGYHSPSKRQFDYSRLGGYRRPKNQQQSENCTLEIRKIPPEYNNIAKLNEHFTQFGMITNLQVCYGGDTESALVTFSTNHEALMAYRSSEALFNNRFIKVFWHKAESPKEGEVTKELTEEEKEEQQKQKREQYLQQHEQMQKLNQQQLEKMTVNVTFTSDSTPNASEHVSAKARLGPPPASKLKVNNTNKTPEKGIVYTSSIGNLKKTVFNPAAVKTSPLTSPTAVKTANFVAKIEAIKKGDEIKKDAIKKKLEIQKHKQELMKKQIEEQKKLIEKLDKNKNMSAEDKTAVMETLKMLTASIEKLKGETSVNKTVPLKSPEQARKEILDAELELMTKQNSGEDTAELRQKLLELTKEATALGLLGRGRGKGRGRGRGSWVRGRGMWTSRGRGHGVLTTGSLSLDKRPKTLEVKGFIVEEKDEIKNHFSACQIEKIEYNDTVPCAIITFKTRKDAERAMARGGKFNDKELMVRWHVGYIRSVSVVSDDSVGGDDEESQVTDDIDEDAILGADEDEEDHEESRSWRK